MALTKIINDENKSFRPVLTDKLVLDATPTEGSYNGVTSDGVAKAIAEGGGGGGVPDVTDPLYVDTDDAVALRYGSGLYLEEGEETDNDTLAVALSGTGGLYYDTMEDNALAVQVDPAGGIENFIDDGVQVGLRVKVDGTSIDVNANGELEALGGGGSTYTAGNGIDINSSNAISVLPDNQTIQVAIPEIKGTKTNFGWRFSTADFPNAEATSKLTQLLLRMDGLGSYTLQMADSSTQSGKNVKLEVGDSFQFTHSVLSTGMVLLNNSYVVLDGTSTTGSLRLLLNNDSTFATAFDFTGDTSFADVFGGQYVFMRFRAWDAVNNEVVGNALSVTSTGDDPSMYMKTDASPVQVSLKYSQDWGTNTFSGLKPSANGVCVSNPVPNSTSDDVGKVLTVPYGGGRQWSYVIPSHSTTDAGKVLQVQNDGTLAWVSGGGVQITFVNRNSDTFATVKNAYNAGNLLYMGNFDFPLVDTDGGYSYFMFQKLSYDIDFGAVYIYQWKIDNVSGWTSNYVQLATQS